MTLSRPEFDGAARAAGLSAEQAGAFWRSLAEASGGSARPKFDPANVAYYFGALIIIGAMGWFMTNAWDFMNGLGMSAIAVCYALLFVVIGRRFWADPTRRTPGGLLLTVAVCMTPLAVYGIERATGFWPANDPGNYTRFHPYIDGSWLLMELTTVLAGLLALRKWKFPFLTAPIAYALWYASMDLPQLFFSSPFSWEEKKAITTTFGLVMLAIAYVADLRGRGGDFAFWGYLFGLMAFWGGLTSMDSNSELGKFLYCLINLGLMFCSLILRRITFIIFGSLGVFAYLGHLSYRVFQDSFVFPFALSFLGLGIIYLGIQYQRRRAALEKWLGDLLLPRLGRFLPPHARD
jgi:hypothetical protein